MRLSWALGALFVVGCGSSGGVVDRIAFTSGRDGNSELYLINSDGSQLKRLTNDPATDDFPLWSPDGKQLSFLSDRDGNWQLWAMDADGRNIRQLTFDPSYHHSPAWAPSGTQISYSSNANDGDWEVYVMNTDGSNITNLTNSPGFDYSPNWSPDGSQVAFVSERDGNSEIYVMNPDGSNQRRLTNNATADWLGSSAWSSTGRILYGEVVGDHRDLRSVLADGSDDRLELPDAHVNVAGWGPDGYSIVMSAGEPRLDVYLVNGGVMTDLTHDPVFADSPDCARITR
jgi:Tol biopolymer transport system component